MLEIDVPLMLLTAIVLFVLIAILNPLLYKPMLKFIDDRNAVSYTHLDVYKRQI